MARPTSPLLDRGQILTGALELLDETGAFTLPGLARRLGVSPSSIYHHVPGGREEIVEGVRGLLTGRRESGPHPGEDWRDFAERWARSYRASMAAHPHVVPLLTAQTVSNPLTLAWYEQLAVVLRDAGFGPDELLHVVTVLDVLVLGSALDAAAPLDVWADPGDDGSALGEAVRATRAQPGDRSLRAFETGLRLLLAGLAGLLPPRGRPPGGGRPAGLSPAPGRPMDTGCRFASPASSAPAPCAPSCSCRGSARSS